jgi:hypothetical protein
LPDLALCDWWWIYFEGWRKWLWHCLLSTCENSPYCIHMNIPPNEVFKYMGCMTNHLTKDDQYSKMS